MLPTVHVPVYPCTNHMFMYRVLYMHYAHVQAYYMSAIKRGMVHKYTNNSFQILADHSPRTRGEREIKEPTNYQPLSPHAGPLNHPTPKTAVHSYFLSNVDQRRACARSLSPANSLLFILRHWSTMPTTNAIHYIWKALALNFERDCWYTVCSRVSLHYRQRCWAKPSPPFRSFVLSGIYLVGIYIYPPRLPALCNVFLTQGQCNRSGYYHINFRYVTTWTSGARDRISSGVCFMGVCVVWFIGHAMLTENYLCNLAK